MRITIGDHCRFVDLVERRPREVRLQAKIPTSKHEQVLEVCERLHMHPMRFYRDAFDAGVLHHLELLQRRPADADA